jgi:predicted dehydrogenase
VVALARSRNRLLMEAIWVRFQPAVLALHAAIMDGRLGTLNTVRSDFSVGGNGEPRGPRHDPRLAGGALLDLGIYPLAMAQDFLGPIGEIVSLGELGDTGVDENLGFITRHIRGGLGVGTVGLRGVGTIALEITGSHALAVSPCSCPPTEITLRTGWGNQTLAVLRDTSGVDGFVHTVRETDHCLAEGWSESPRITHSQSIELAHFLELTWRKTGVAYPSVDLTL